MHVPDPNMMLLIVSSVNGLCNGGMQLKGELLYCLDFKKTFDIIPMVILWGKNKETEETNGLYHLLYFDLCIHQLLDFIQEAIGAHEEKPAMGYFPVLLLIFMQTMFVLFSIFSAETAKPFF